MGIEERVVVEVMETLNWGSRTVFQRRNMVGKPSYLETQRLKIML